MLSLVAHAAEAVSEPALAPFEVGAIALTIEIVLMAGLLMFGKGREHN